MKQKRWVARITAVALCVVFLLMMFSVVIRSSAESAGETTAAVWINE